MLAINTTGKSFWRGVDSFNSQELHKDNIYEGKHLHKNHNWFWKVLCTRFCWDNCVV